MIRADHPTVRTMAAKMAEEQRNVLPGWCRMALIATPTGLGIPPELIAAQIRLLTDFTRPATCDAWVRWLQSLPNVDLGDWSVTPSTLRDDPAALEAAVSAALETM